MRYAFPSMNSFNFKGAIKQSTEPTTAQWTQDNSSTKQQLLSINLHLFDAFQTEVCKVCKSNLF